MRVMTCRMHLPPDGAMVDDDDDNKCPLRMPTCRSHHPSVGAFAEAKDEAETGSEALLAKLTQLESECAALIKFAPRTKSSESRSTSLRPLAKCKTSPSGWQPLSTCPCDDNLPLSSSLSSSLSSLSSSSLILEEEPDSLDLLVPSEQLGRDYA